MGEPRRVNFAYVGGTQPEWEDHLKRSAQVMRLSGMTVDYPPAEESEKPPAPRQRRDIPDFRRTPAEDSVPIAALALSLPFETSTGIDIRFTDVRVYSTGVAFQIVAHEPALRNPPPMNAPGVEKMNLSSTVRPDMPHQIRLIVDLAEGPLLSNSADLYGFPAEPSVPWLYGGGGYRGIDADLDGIVTGASYFLSPRPESGQVWITIAYPEFGIEMTTLELDASIFSLETDR